MQNLSRQIDPEEEVRSPLIRLPNRPGNQNIIPQIYLSQGGKGDFRGPAHAFPPLFREPDYCTSHTSDDMSDAPSTSTPRLSDMSSVDSPRTSLDQRNSTPGGPQGTKANGGGIGSDDVRVRSSPDSDALSSEEETDQSKMLFAQSKNSAVSQFSSRRPSYAAEFQTRQRTYSSGGPLSPTTSHPAAPSGDTAAWAAGVSATTTAALGGGPPQQLSPFWNTMSGSIWNSELSRKSPPNPLGSPAAGPGQSHSPLFTGSEALPSPTTMPASSGEFPLSVPPQPLFRNYRSMSFSVGQMEMDDPNRPRLSPPAGLSGAKHPPPTGLQHRPSRPSLLSGEQYPGEPTPLRSVTEMDDDEEAGKSHESSKIQSLYHQQQNNLLRSQYENLSRRNRSASAATIPSMAPVLGASTLGGRDNDRIEEYESAIGEEDDGEYAPYQAEARRFSEAPRSMSLMYTPSGENQRMETLRRQHWASNGSPLTSYVETGTQSRRHSFAGRLPLNDAPEADYGIGNSDLLSRRNSTLGESGLSGLSRDSLYLNEEARMRAARHSIAAVKSSGLLPQSSIEHLQQMPYPSPGRFPHQPSPPPGPTRSMMGMPTHHVQQPRSQQLLYFVTFKAQRGDVFFVQEGTGLRVRVGDLVIVEADRGTDLGTVVAENVNWQKAKELKEQYAKEQYNVLMMYASRRTTAAGAPPGGLHNGMGGHGQGFPNAGSGPMSGHGQQPGQDGASGELKPKMIKRLAQPHEIQTLRDKEANEAKAKRVCQQKVIEHRLPMEILDAEFQMDWKKLTFYYFADSYINFNSLVTDLFKVYKTRIWMSAMNPASFAHPTTGLHPPGSGIAPSSTLGAIGEVASDSHYAGMGSPYGGYASSNGAGGSFMGTPQRGLAQQNPMHLGLYQSQHSPHTTLPPQEFSSLAQQNLGYGNSYLNGATGLTGQSPYGNGDHGLNGNVDAPWMGLQSLSLNSH